MTVSVLITLFLLLVLEGSSLIRHFYRHPLQQQHQQSCLYGVQDELWAGINSAPSNIVIANEVDNTRNMVLNHQLKNKPTPSEELLRFEGYTRLRQRMYELIRKEGCDSRRGWVRAFERWQYSAKTFEWEESARTTQASNKVHTSPFFLRIHDRLIIPASNLSDTAIPSNNMRP